MFADYHEDRILMKAKFKNKGDRNIKKAKRRTKGCYQTIKFVLSDEAQNFMVDQDDIFKDRLLDTIKHNKSSQAV